MKTMLEKFEEFLNRTMSGEVRGNDVYTGAKDLIDELVEKEGRISLNEKDGLVLFWGKGETVVYLDNEINTLDEMEPETLFLMFARIFDDMKREEKLGEFEFPVKRFVLDISSTGVEVDGEVVVYATSADEAMELFKEGLFFVE